MSERESELGSRHHASVDTCGAFDLSAVFTSDEDFGGEVEFVSGSYDASEARAIDHREQRVHVSLSVQPTCGFEEHTAQLRQRFDEQRAGHDRMAWKMVAEDIVGQRHALDSRGKIGRFQASDSIEKDVTHEGRGE